MNAKFIGLIILSEAIKTRWKVLGGAAGDQARAGIKNFLVKKIIELSSDEVPEEREEHTHNSCSLTGGAIWGRGAIRLRSAAVAKIGFLE